MNRAIEKIQASLKGLLQIISIKAFKVIFDYRNPAAEDDISAAIKAALVSSVIS